MAGNQVGAVGIHRDRGVSCERPALVGGPPGPRERNLDPLGVLFALLTPVVAKVIMIMRTSRRRAKFADQIDDTRAADRRQPPGGTRTLAIGGGRRDRGGGADRARSSRVS